MPIFYEKSKHRSEFCLPDGSSSPTVSSMVPLFFIASFYAAAVFIAEITLGSAEFPLHFWYFSGMPAWQWSVPVHGAGFLWIALWTRALRSHPAILSMAVSWAFFIAAETINRFCLLLFDYSSETLGIEASFSAVLALYAMLCAVIVYTLRKFVFDK